MKRLRFLGITVSAILLQLLGAISLSFAMQATESYQQLTYGGCGALLVIATLIMIIKASAERIKDIKPDADLILYSMLFWILNLITSGIAYLVLMVWPSAKAKLP